MDLRYAIRSYKIFGLCGNGLKVLYRGDLALHVTDLFFLRPLRGQCLGIVHVMGLAIEFIDYIFRIIINSVIAQ